MPPSRPTINFKKNNLILCIVSAQVHSLRPVEAGSADRRLQSPTPMNTPRWSRKRSPIVQIAQCFVPRCAHDTTINNCNSLQRRPWLTKCAQRFSPGCRGRGGLYFELSSRRSIANGTKENFNGTRFATGKASHAGWTAASYTTTRGSTSSGRTGAAGMEIDTAIVCRNASFSVVATTPPSPMNRRG